MAGAAAEVIAIFGPTASGKTVVAEGVALRLGTEVVSADALQVYRGLEIITNQPAAGTHLVGIRDLDEEMSVGEYARLAHERIDALIGEHGTAVLAGGTGLYLRAALVDLAIPPSPSPETRRRWEERYDESPSATFSELATRDPAAAARVHVNDRRRVVRALELTELGASLAPHGTDSRLWTEEVRRPTLLIGLDVPADELERRIRARTSEMVARGAAAEARLAHGRGVSRTAAKALGLDELVRLPEGEALERIVVRTRRYASYQRKWMRRIPGLVSLDATRPTEQVVDEIVDLARAR